jgi:hypothetical protein
MHERLKSRYLLFVILIILATILLIIAMLGGWLNVYFFIGPFLFAHWLGIAGTAFIAIYVPIYSLLRRNKLKTPGALLATHILGNLLAVMLISIHFISQVYRVIQALPQVAAGALSYFILLALVVTGILLSFGILKRLERLWKFIHITLAAFFYLVTVIHLLHVLNIFNFPFLR